MTNKEALQATISEHSFNDRFVDKVLIDRGLDGSVNYIASDYVEIEICKAFLYKNIALNADFKQGSYSVSEKQAKQMLAEANRIFLANKLKSKITNKTIIYNL